MENDLMEYLGEKEVAEVVTATVTDEAEQKKFVVTDLVGADWCFGKIKILEAELQKQQAYIDVKKAELQNIIDYEESTLKDHERNRSYFEHLLREWAEKELVDNPKFKIKCVNGTASYGKLQEKLQFDDKKMLEFLERDERFVKVETVEKLDKTAVKKAIAISGDKAVLDGEVLDFVEIQKVQNFNVKIK